MFYQIKSVHDKELETVTSAGVDFAVFIRQLRERVKTYGRVDRAKTVGSGRNGR